MGGGGGGGGAAANVVAGTAVQIAINVSANQLARTHSPPVAHMVRAAGVDPHLVEL